MNATLTAQPRTDHPDWCLGSGLDLSCGNHLSAAVNVPATAGDWKAAGGHALFPLASVSAEMLRDGTPAVCVALTPPDGNEVEASFRIAEAVALRDALDAAITLALTEGRT